MKDFNFTKAIGSSLASWFHELVKVKHRKLAKEICYDFADCLGKAGSIILDDRLLPYPRDEIKTAFLYYKSILRKTNQVWELNRIEAIEMHIDDFCYIEPEDRQIVEAINSGRGVYSKFKGDPSGWPSLDSEEDKIAEQLYTLFTMKYMRHVPASDLNPLQK